MSNYAGAKPYNDLIFESAVLQILFIFGKAAL